MITPTIDADEGILLGEGREGTLTGGRLTSIRQLADAIEILVIRNRELANQHHAILGDVRDLAERVSRLERRVEHLERWKDR